MATTETGMTTRQKAIGGVFALIFIYLGYTVIGMLGIGKSAPPPPPPVAAMPTPKPAALPTAEQAATSPQEMQLLKMQQELQTKYIAAMNELQMLKITRDIANANTEIVSAKLAAVTAEQKIVDLLAPAPSAPPPPPTSSGPAANAAPIGPPMPATHAVNYKVSSVVELQHTWTAVLSADTTLYNVHEGDTLPADGSKVIKITKSGVTLDLNGVQTVLSVTPVI